MTKEQIGSFVLDERKRQGLSQKALAAKVGLTRYQQILEIEKNQFDYGVDVLIKVLNALGVTIALNGTSQSVQKEQPASAPTIFDFSKAQPAKEEEQQVVDKKSQPKKTPTAVFKRKRS
jgi:transcriptional regulator with XRE-family HTH domain